MVVVLDDSAKRFLERAILLTPTEPPLREPRGSFLDDNADCSVAD
jgi:hypothetical protein